MSVVLKVRSSVDTSFEFKGENADLWLKTILRVLNTPKYHYKQGSKGSAVVEVCSDRYSDTVWLNGLGVRLLRARIGNAQLFINIEKAIEQISLGKWDDFEYCFEHEEFLFGVRRTWSLACQDGLLEFERKVFDVVAENGGLSVDTIVSRLIIDGVMCDFKGVREALFHLRKLYVVEKQHGQFGIRYGIIEDA